MRVSAWLTTAALGAFLAVAPGAAAQGTGHGSDASLGVRFGTLGIGGEVAKLVNSHVAVRAGANFFSHTFNHSESDITYDVSLKLKGVSGLIDLFPSARGSFHLTGGVMTRPADVTGKGQPSGSGTYTINNHEYTTAQVGTLTGTAKWPSASPYVGLGWGTPAAKHGALKFVFDLGAVIGKPTIALTATGAGSNAQLQSDLDAQIATTQDDVNKYAKVYPVLSFGLVYRF